MESRIKLLGHPPHQMLVAFPLGAFGFSIASDVLHTCTGERRYERAAAQAIDFALVSAAIAIPLGAVDWLVIPRGTRARRVGFWHAVGNGALVGLLSMSRELRSRPRGLLAAKCLSGAAFLLSGVTAWLGGELVNRHGIGVSDHTGLNLPSSIDEGWAANMSARREPLPR
jgi:uncharacterized membrane protein